MNQTIFNKYTLTTEDVNKFFSVEFKQSCQASRHIRKYIEDVIDSEKFIMFDSRGLIIFQFNGFFYEDGKEMSLAFLLPYKENPHRMSLTSFEANFEDINYMYKIDLIGE